MVIKCLSKYTYTFLARWFCYHMVFTVVDVSFVTIFLVFFYIVELLMVFLYCHMLNFAEY